MINDPDVTDNELYDIIKNGINKDMTDDEVIRVIKYVMKTLPTYNKIKGTAEAIEMVMKMFSLSCQIINLWHTTDVKDKDKAIFFEETALKSLNDYYLTSRFNVDVYYSNLSFVEFTKNVGLFIKLIESVKPITRILNQISFIVDEFKQYNFYDCMKIIDAPIFLDTITFTDSDFGMKSPFKKFERIFFVPSVDTNGDNAYSMLLNLVNAPNKNFELTVENLITENNLYIEVDGVQKTLAELKRLNDDLSSYIRDLPGYLSNSVTIKVDAIFDANKLIYNAYESGITITTNRYVPSDFYTQLSNAYNYSTIIPKLTELIKRERHAKNVIVKCTGIEHPTIVTLTVNRAFNTHSFMRIPTESSGGEDEESI